jgi:hypothetical protein
MRLIDGLASYDVGTQVAKLVLLQNMHTLKFLQSVCVFFNMLAFGCNEDAVVLFQKQAEIFGSVGVPSKGIVQNQLPTLLKCYEAFDIPHIVQSDLRACINRPHFEKVIVK